MLTRRILLCLCILLGGTLAAIAWNGFTPRELRLLQNPEGWEYVSISDPDSGIQTKHTCFDGKPHPDECSGTLTLNEDNTFVQQVFVHHQSVARHGRYQLEGAQITFYDEFGTRDGPYALDLNSEAETLKMQIANSAGVMLRVEMESQRAYRKQLKDKKK